MNRLKRSLFAGCALVVLLWMAGCDGNADTVNETAVSLEEVGGFEQWRNDGFKQTVRTTIGIADYYIQAEDENCYALVGKPDDIMEENIDEIYDIAIEQKNRQIRWVWLQEAEMDSDTMAYYVYATLSYTGHSVNEEEFGKDAIPIFKISDVEVIPLSEIKNVDTPNSVEDNGSYGSVYDQCIEEVYSEVMDENPYSFVSYAVYDMDKDGVLELFIMYGTGEADAVCDIYSEYGDEAIYIGQIGCGHTELYCCDSSGFYTDYCQMGYEKIKHVYVQEGNLIEETVFEGDAGAYGNAEKILQTPIEMQSFEE